jgi:hypothetical protein
MSHACRVKHSILPGGRRVCGGRRKAPRRFRSGISWVVSPSHDERPSVGQSSDGRSTPTSPPPCGNPRSLETVGSALVAGLEEYGSWVENGEDPEERIGSADDALIESGRARWSSH